MKNEDLIAIGFKELPHENITNAVIFDLGRRRHLSAGSVGTPNEMLWIFETSKENPLEILDLVCLHNWDYDKELTIEKVKTLINVITGSNL